MRLGVLVSGEGTNLQAIVDATANGALHAEVAVVVSSRAEAPALARARHARVPTMTLPPREYPDRASYDEHLVRVLRHHRVDWVVLAGFMRILSSTALDAFPSRIVNLHPSLLPAFPGLHAVRQALAAGVRTTGATVHLVDEGVDTGPILAQASVPVLDGDDEATLGARLRTVEHHLLVRVLESLARGGLPHAIQ